MKKFLAMLLMLVLALSCVSFASADDVPVLTVAIADKTNIEDFNTNWETLYIEEQLGVDLDMHVYDSTDYTTKINLMIQSGDKLEDILIVGPSDALIMDWAALEAIVPLTAYYADPEISPNIHEAYERVGYDFSGLMIMPDGEIYGIPVLNQSYGNEHGEGRLWIYKPWLEALDAEMPTTTEELKAVLEKAVATDLNGNGIADEMGLVGYNGVSGQWFNFLMDAFVTCNPGKNWMVVNDGVVSFAYTTPEWRQGIEYIKSLFDAGLMPTENLTQDFTAYKTMVNSTDVTSFTVAYTNADGMTDIDRKGDYYVVAPITGPNGFASTTYNPSTPSARFFVSADCENPELAFRVGDLLVCEELSIITRFGGHGADEEWQYISELANADDYENPYPLFPPYVVMYHDSDYWGSGAMQNKSWMQQGPYIRQYGIAAGMAVPKGRATEFDLRFAEGCTVYQTSEANPKEYIAKLIYSAEEQEIVTDVSTELNTYVKETMAAWLTGAQVLDDASWDAFQKQVEALNAAGWLACAQAAYDRSIGK